MSSKLLGRRGGRQGRHDVGVVEGRVRDGERDLSDRVRESKSNRISQIGRGLVLLHLKACARRSDFIHTLVAKCGYLEHAHKIFDEMPEKNVVSWTAVICGYIKGFFIGWFFSFKDLISSLIMVLYANGHLHCLKGNLKPDCYAMDFGMRISKTEVNLKRLLAAAPQQQNQAKLVHYVATLRELVEQLAEERTPEGLPRVSKAVLSDYSEKIEAIASKLAAPPPDIQTPEVPLARISVKANSSDTGDNQIPPSPGLRRRFVPISNTEDGTRETAGVDSSGPVKLDAAAQAHIEKHRKLQEDLTDEMVGLARQLKESSLMMSHSLENTEKILDSTEKAVESSLASTRHATTRAAGIYSRASKTTCFTWLLMFVMTFVFTMVVLLIRVT
ncbi:hypothetical protein ACFX2F_043400 [Malus domestica]